MSLTIEDPRVIALAHRLAGETGETVEQLLLRTLTASASSSAPRAKSAAEIDAALAAIHALPLLGENIDHGELLYDEHGLPK